jgi:hypothetical protein
MVGGDDHCQPVTHSYYQRPLLTIHELLSTIHFSSHFGIPIIELVPSPSPMLCLESLIYGTFPGK